MLLCFLPIISVDLTTKTSSPASSPPALFSFIIHRADQVYTIHKVLLLCAIILSPALLPCFFLLTVDGFGSLLSFSSFASFSLSRNRLHLCATLVCSSSGVRPLTRHAVCYVILCPTVSARQQRLASLTTEGLLSSYHYVL